MAEKAILIPELAVTDVPAAASLLRDVFGFVDDGGLMRLGDQAVALVAVDAPGGYGVIDHLALAVADLDATLAAMQARGALLEATTPNGPREIAEFWDAGMRYVFLAGPEGARIELCARRDGTARAGLPGHDHLGIPCTDIAASVTFWVGLGAQPMAAVNLTRADGVTHVRFLSLGDSVVELYEPPALRGRAADFAATALWRGVRLAGSGQVPGPRRGPDGLRVTVV